MSLKILFSAPVYDKEALMQFSIPFLSINAPVEAG